jgi:ribose transport system substrate-binding protein
VLSAIDAAGRDEFFMVGGAGSKNAMDLIKSGDSILEATIIYPSTQAADGIRLARLLAQDKSLADLVEVEVPNRIVLSAPVVTAENVEKYLPTAFAS